MWQMFDYERMLTQCFPLRERYINGNFYVLHLILLYFVVYLRTPPVDVFEGPYVYVLYYVNLNLVMLYQSLPSNLPTHSLRHDFFNILCKSSTLTKMIS